MTVQTIPDLKPEQRFLIRNVDWNFYDSLRKTLGDRHIFVTYDRGNLEIMAPSPAHEKYKVIIRRFAEAMIEELDTDFKGVGSMTCRRQDLDRGLEPDECYYIRSADRIADVA